VEKKLKRIPLVTASEEGRAQSENPLGFNRVELWSEEAKSAVGPGRSGLERPATDGDSPVQGWETAAYDLLSTSRLAWECRLNRDVNSFQG
jgi:hypothetical protein